MDIPKSYIFVISPIGAEDSAHRQRADEVLELVIDPVAHELGLLVQRSDLDPTPGQITTQMIRHIVEATVIVADLTGANPNVFYELGVAHSFGRPHVLLVDDPTELPFDTKSARTIALGSGDALLARQVEKAKTELRKALATVTADGFNPTNLVTEAAAARSLDMLQPENPIATEIGAIRDELATLTKATRRDSVRRILSQQHEADINALKGLVEAVVRSRMISPLGLSTLKSEDTSGSFDEWVDRIGAAGSLKPEPPSTYDPAEEPF